MGIIIIPNEAVGRVNKIIHGKYLAQFLAHSKRSNYVPNTQEARKILRVPAKERSSRWLRYKGQLATY